MLWVLGTELGFFQSQQELVTAEPCVQSRNSVLDREIPLKDCNMITALCVDKHQRGT